MATLPDYFSGTSNVVLPVPNKTFFPPAFQTKSRLAYYASLFNSVEVNSSFYKTPRAITVAKWVDDVPDGFRFTFKLSREITHDNKLIYDHQTLKHFVETLSCLGSKNGCLLVQLPPSMTVDLKRMENLLSHLSEWEMNQSVAVEFRNSSWYIQDVYDLLNYYNAAMVLHDMPKSYAPVLHTSSTFVYLRFHGPEGGYRGSYTDDFLAEYATYINEWREEGKTVYTYFNNTMGNAIGNLLTLNSFVGQQG